MRLLTRLRRSFIAARPDVFVGIDAPDTNLRLARTYMLPAFQPCNT
jgi:lipid A disaccharide synthetase